MLSFPHSLARNNLVDEWGVNKSEVQGSSFEVGAKVTYEGREMTVSQAPDSDGHMTMMDLSGVMALAASLPECGLTSLECAAPKCLPLCQRPMTRLLSHRPHPDPRLQYRAQRHRSRGRLRARRHPQGDADHHPGVSHRPRLFAFVSAPIDMHLLSHCPRPTHGQSLSEQHRS